MNSRLKTDRRTGWPPCLALFPRLVFFFTCAFALASLAGGCASTPARHQISQPIGPGISQANTNHADRLPAGNPDAFAHYAAGVSYELNDSADKALQQFDDAALADPANEALVLRLAEHFLSAHQADKAVNLLSKSAQRPNASEQIYGWLARAELVAGNTNACLAAARKAVEKDPTSVDGYESLLEPLLQTGQLTEAARLLSRAGASVAREPHTLAAVAELYGVYLRAAPKDKSAEDKAVALLDKVSAMSFSSPRLWQRVADLYTRLNQPKKAATIYERLLAGATDASPEKLAYREQLAQIYLASDDRTNALKQLTAIVRDDPTGHPNAWFALGELAVQDEKFRDAIDDFENAIRERPDIEPAYYDLALAQANAHRTEDALKTLGSARERFDNMFRYEFYTGLVQRQAKDYPEAIRHFTAAETVAKATATNLLDKAFYFELGAAYERNQQFAEADHYLQKAIDLDPHFAEALNYLGFMWADRGEQLDRARVLIERALKLEPQNGAYLDSMGWVLYKLKLPDEALPWMLKAVAANPEPDATILDHLGDVYLALGQSGKALDAWRKSVAIDPNPDVKRKVDLNSRS